MGHEAAGMGDPKWRRVVGKALRAALGRYEEAELDERHRAGYRKAPPAEHESDIPEADHAWVTVGEGRVVRLETRSVRTNSRARYSF